MIKKPFFLVGAERSGTTLLRLMLNHHPQISWILEFEYSVNLITDKIQFPSLNIYYDWLETRRIFLSMGFSIDKNLDYPQLIDSFLLQKYNPSEHKIIGATVHRHFDRILSYLFGMTLVLFI